MTQRWRSYDGPAPVRIWQMTSLPTGLTSGHVG
jgi:hypothetical protein